MPGRRPEPREPGVPTDAQEQEGPCLLSLLDRWELAQRDAEDPVAPDDRAEDARAVSEPPVPARLLCAREGGRERLGFPVSDPKGMGLVGQGFVLLVEPPSEGRLLGSGRDDPL